MFFPCHHSTFYRAQQKQEAMTLSSPVPMRLPSLLSKAWTGLITTIVEYIMSPIQLFLFFICLPSKAQALPFTFFFKSSDDAEVWVEGICHRCCSSFSFTRRICARCTAGLYKSRTHYSCHFRSDEGERKKLLANNQDWWPFFSDMSACLYCQWSWHHLSLLPAPWFKQESGTAKRLCRVNYFRRL